VAGWYREEPEDAREQQANYSAKEEDAMPDLPVLTGGRVIARRRSRRSIQGGERGPGLLRLRLAIARSPKTLRHNKAEIVDSIECRDFPVFPTFGGE
jgi:hypothetical protein